MRTNPARTARRRRFVRGSPGHTDADGDDGLPEGDDDDEPVALDEVARLYVKALDAANPRDAVIQRDCGEPKHALKRLAHEPGDDEEKRRTEKARREAEYRVPRFRRRGESVEDDVQPTNDEVRGGEDDRIGGECPRNRQCDHQHGRHR